MPISLPSDLVVDLRDPVAGDSYGWEAIEPAAAKKWICIHGTGVNSATQDGFTIADYHVNHNGFGGVGVHAICTQDDYPGRPGVTSPGAQIHYIGDLLTWRAGVANNNPGVIHIEIAGLFTPGNGVPSEGQLRKVRALLEYLLAPNNLLPSLNYWSQVTYHNRLAIQPAGATACPGWQHPQFNEWFAYLQGGAEPSWWHPVPVAVTDPVTQAPIVPAEPTGQPSGVIPVTVVPPTPEWEESWIAQPEVRSITREGAVAIDTTGKVLTQIAVGTEINIGGYFTINGTEYARTVWATDNGKWNGIDTAYLQGTTGQVDQVASDVTDQQLQEATVPETKKPTLLELLKELWAQIIAHFIKRTK